MLKLLIYLVSCFSLTPTKDENNEITEEEEEPEPLEGVHLMFDSEAADLLPVVVRFVHLCYIISPAPQTMFIESLVL